MPFVFVLIFILIMFLLIIFDALDGKNSYKKLLILLVVTIWFSIAIINFFDAIPRKIEYKEPYNIENIQVIYFNNELINITKKLKKIVHNNQIIKISSPVSNFSYGIYFLPTCSRCITIIDKKEIKNNDKL